jgi:hypothetical protein
MRNRYIDLSQYDADPRVMAWLEANGLDPHEIPANQHAQIFGEHLTVIEFVLEQTVPGAPPHKTMADDGSGYKKRLRTVPLLSAPEDHNL